MCALTEHALLNVQGGIVQVEEKILVYGAQVSLVEDGVVGGAVGSRRQARQIDVEHVEHLGSDVVALVVESLDELRIEFVQLVSVEVKPSCRAAAAGGGEQEREQLGRVEARRLVVVVESGEHGLDELGECGGAQLDDALPERLALEEESERGDGAEADGASRATGAPHRVRQDHVSHDVLEAEAQVDEARLDRHALGRDEYVGQEEQQARTQLHVLARLESRLQDVQHLAEYLLRKSFKIFKKKCIKTKLMNNHEVHFRLGAHLPHSWRSRTKMNGSSELSFHMLQSVSSSCKNLDM